MIKHFFRQTILIQSVAIIVSHSFSSALIRHEKLSPVSIFFEARQEEETTTEGPISHLNSTLDFWGQYKDANGSKVDYWTGAQDGISHYFEYYNDTAIFKSQHDQEDSCAHFMPQGKLDELSEVNGIWVACQDSSLPRDCATVTPQAPCSPFINFNNGMAHNPLARTIKMTFALEELAILRLTVKGSCFDYSRRRDMFSSCEFNELNDSDAVKGWYLVHFSFYPDQIGTFDAFTLQLIVRFQHDVILIDKIETTDYLLCVINDEEINCPTRPTTAFPTFTTTTPIATTEPSTTDGPILTDPWQDSSTPVPSAASLINYNFILVVISTPLYFLLFGF